MKPTEKQIPEIASIKEDLVLYKEENSVVTLTLNRPKKFNALSEQMLNILQENLDYIATNESIRIVIIQGSGKAFCAGHDLKEIRTLKKKSNCQKLFKKI